MAVDNWILPTLEVIEAAHHFAIDSCLCQRCGDFAAGHSASIRFTYNLLFNIYATTNLILAVLALSYALFRLLLLTKILVNSFFSKIVNSVGNFMFLPGRVGFLFSYQKGRNHATLKKNQIHTQNVFKAKQTTTLYLNYVQWADNKHYGVLFTPSTEKIWHKVVDHGFTIAS